MIKNKRGNSANQPEKSSDKEKDDDPDKREPDPDDQNEETGPPIKEMPDKSQPQRDKGQN
ncbi:hypothetical protein DYD21_13810 [Rhodohalobacter sp. SW132]|uniref:hypothetical protein n=1 Tax=Rhodohalobacter sp. SW132 TaxID=2293433 RepID=UPI000E3A8438|nr:hypothetical protein [Rhodohalobacter sp. SW132]REL32892.1 hypothetical protein DYD21_13810 [Rhodohalobacter sp. SW132]